MDPNNQIQTAYTPEYIIDDETRALLSVYGIDGNARISRKDNYFSIVNGELRKIRMEGQNGKNLELIISFLGERIANFTDGLESIKESEDLVKIINSLRTLVDEYNGAFKKLNVPYDLNKLLSELTELQKTAVEKRKELILRLLGGKRIIKIWRRVLEQFPVMNKIAVRFVQRAEGQRYLACVENPEKDDFSEKKVPVLKVTDKLLAERMEHTSRTKRRAAKILNVPEEVQSSELMNIVILLHELGHAYDWFENYETAEDPREKRRIAKEKDWEREPLLKLTVEEIRDQIRTDLSGFLERNPRFRDEKDVEKAAGQARWEAYTNTTEEAYADNFAAAFVENNREDLFPETKKTR